MNPETITSLRRQAEDAVADMPEGSMKVKAFEVILSRLLDGADGHTRSREHVVRSRKSKDAGAKANPPSSIREEVKKLEISPDENGLPPWGALGILDKYLWILEAAHKKNIDGLTNAEISALIYKVFKENLPSKSVGNLKTRIKKMHVRSADVLNGAITISVWQILKAGIEHLWNLTSPQGSKK